MGSRAHGQTQRHAENGDLEHAYRAVPADQRSAREPREHRNRVGEPDPLTHRRRRRAKIGGRDRGEHRGHRQGHRSERLHREGHRHRGDGPCGAGSFAAAQNRRRGPRALR